LHIAIKTLLTEQPKSIRSARRDSKTIYLIGKSSSIRRTIARIAPTFLQGTKKKHTCQLTHTKDLPKIDIMLSGKIASLLSLVATAIAGSLTLVSLDDQDRTMYFTPNAGLPEIPPVTVLAGDQVRVTFPEKWQGNGYAIVAGQPNVPGMLAEIAFDSWQGQSFFDVSAIVDPNDHTGVHMMYPTDDPSEVISGCVTFPCDNAYYVWNDDKQTKGTSASDITVTLGVNGISQRSVQRGESPSFPHHFVERTW
jgi:hypothetical protein